MEFLILGSLKGDLNQLEKLRNSDSFLEVQKTCELIESENYAAIASLQPKICLKLQFHSLLLEEKAKEALILLKCGLANQLNCNELAELSSLLFVGRKDLIEEAKAGEKRNLFEAFPVAASLHTRLETLLERAQKYQKSFNPLHCSILCDFEASTVDLFSDKHACKSFNECFETNLFADYRTATTNVAFLADGSLKHWNANEANTVSCLSPSDYFWPVELLSPETFADGKLPHCLAVLKGENKIVWSCEERLTMLSSLDDLRTIEHCWAPLRASYLLPCLDGSFLAIQNDGIIRHLSTRSSDSYAVLKELSPPEQNILVAAAAEHKGALALSCNNDTIYWYSDWREYGYPTKIFRGHQCKKFHSGLLVLDGESDDERDWLLVSASESAEVVVWAVGSGRCVGRAKAAESGQIVQLLPSADGHGFLSLSSEGVIQQWRRRSNSKKN